MRVAVLEVREFYTHARDDRLKAGLRTLKMSGSRDSRQFVVSLNVE